MDQSGQNRLISSALLKWTSLLTSKQITTFEQLTTGEFYLELLSCVKEFKLIKPIKCLSFESQSTLTLANRVSNIKTIGDSVVRFYQSHLMKDISQMKINYVEMCMGNCQEAIKLFSLVVGIFVEENGEVFRKFQQALDKLEPDDQYIIRALLENTKTIGESIIKNEDSPYQKKMLTKLQTYEEKIEHLELQNDHLSLQLEEQRQLKESLQLEVKELKSQKFKLIQKAQVLQVLNSRLESQNSAFMMQNDNLVKKLQSQKRHYDQLLAKNQQKLTLYEKQIKLVDSMKHKIDELKIVNFELKQQLTQQIDSSKVEEEKFRLMRENYKVLQEKLTKIQTKLSQVELEYQEFRYKHETDSAIKPRNKHIQSPAYHFSNNSQLSSLKYRMRDRLESALKGQLSQYQMVNSHMVRKDSKDKIKNSRQLNFRDSTLMNGQNLMSSTCQYHNLSNFVINEIGNPNIRDIEDVSEFDGDENGVKRFHEEEQLDRSLIIDEEQIEKKSLHDGNNLSVRQNNAKRHLQQNGDLKAQQNTLNIIEMISEQAQQEHSLLIQVITELYDQNQHLKRQLRKYQVFRKNKESRVQEFKKKLKQIRQIQPISQINHRYQAHKENLNVINVLPGNIKGQNIGQENLLIKNRLRQDGQRNSTCSYYQVTIN